jgi:predicted O-methyltransferase YrrM
VVAQCCPDCAVYGFDLWLEGYAGVENPGAEFVRRELNALGHRGELMLISGDSRRTVPAFLAEHPDLFFDLITVDGDHSVAGAAADLANVLPRLKVGGALAFDDINSVYVLRRVWRDLVKHDGRFLTWEYTDAGNGVAVAVRVSDGPLAATLRGGSASGP